jgi:hypothetical protein
MSVYVIEFIQPQLPGQVDPSSGSFAQSFQQNYTALNERLLSQLNYQLADSDSKVCVCASIVLQWSVHQKTAHVVKAHILGDVNCF